LSASPQHDLPSSQQAAPSLQQVWTALQQPCNLSQHLRPCSQQPCFFGAVQQALPLAQQACFDSQQFALAAPFSAAASFEAVAANPRANPMSSTELLANALNIKTSKEISRAFDSLAIVTQ
jgi:hypothetical protein